MASGSSENSSSRSWRTTSSTPDRGRESRFAFLSRLRARASRLALRSRTVARGDKTGDSEPADSGELGAAGMLTTGVGARAGEAAGSAAAGWSDRSFTGSCRSGKGSDGKAASVDEMSQGEASDLSLSVAESDSKEISRAGFAGLQGSGEMDRLTYFSGFLATGGARERGTAG